MLLVKWLCHWGNLSEELISWRGGGLPGDPLVSGITLPRFFSLPLPRFALSVLDRNFVRLNVGRFHCPVV